MKIDKMQQKELDKQIKEIARAHGFKFSGGFLFSHIADDFVYVICTIVNSSELAYLVKIKKFSYDDVFWDIINMPDNKNQPISLRARGAFASPSISIADGKIPLNPDFCSVAETLCNIICEEVSKFRANYDINEYIIEHDNIPYASTLKCLAYIDLHNPALAVKVAKASIEAGDRDGGFENEGKGFFEWVLYRYSTEENQ